MREYRFLWFHEHEKIGYAIYLCLPLALVKSQLAPVVPPRVALGTAGHLNGNSSLTASMVSRFIKLGGSHIDTAIMYYNLRGVGEGIRKRRVSRNSIFLTTKLPMESMGERARDAVERALVELGTPYVDLLLVHWPGKVTADLGHDPHCVRWSAAMKAMPDWGECRRITWTIFQQLQAEGKAKAIGVSNYEVPHLQEIIDAALPLPAVNQVEFHPWWRRENLLEFMRTHAIDAFGYGLLGGRPFARYHQVASAAEAHAISPAQVLLRWQLQKGVGVVMGATSARHMRDALNALSGQLTAAEMSYIDQLGPQGRRYLPDPRAIYSPGAWPNGVITTALGIHGTLDALELGRQEGSCWSDQFTREKCCPAGGSNACWDSQFSFDTCCIELMPHPAHIADWRKAPADEDWYDFVVVGSGSGGASAARYLARHGTVALIEAGELPSGERFTPIDRPDRFFKIPLRWELGALTRHLNFITGKTVGGSSAVNGQLWSGGHADLPHGHKLAFDDLFTMDSFKISKNLRDFHGAASRVPEFIAAAFGAPYRPISTLGDIFYLGARAGVSEVVRFAGGKHVSAFDTVVDQVPAAVKLHTKTYASKLLFEGSRALGVDALELASNNLVGQRDMAQVMAQITARRIIRARREVLLAAGALQTPMLLARSGVASIEDVRRAGATLVAENAAVGQNLQEHWYLPVKVRLPREGDSLCEAPEFIAFVSTDGDRPDFEVLGKPRCRDDALEFELFLIILHSARNNRVIAVSANPLEPPHIDLNLATGDFLRFGAAIQRLHQGLIAFGTKAEIDVPLEVATDHAALGQHLARHLGLWQHPSGTCSRCVDQETLRVRGVEGVRVADASAIWDSISGHPDGPVRQLGHTAAMLAGKI